jgi:hypothetical protein
VNESDIDRALRQNPPVNPELVAKISGDILPKVGSVRPLPGRAVIQAQAIAAAALIAVAGASGIGFYGIQRLTAGESSAIFSAVAFLLWLAAATATAAIVPGSRQRVRPLSLTALACAALVAVFAAIFHDYSTASFVHQGIACLTAGLADAAPAAVIIWLVLRRGFAVDARAAGAAGGALAGLAGLFMLELHCPIFKAPHAMVWHVAVIPICAAVGAFLGTLVTMCGREKGVRPLD